MFDCPAKTKTLSGFGTSAAGKGDESVAVQTRNRRSNLIEGSKFVVTRTETPEFICNAAPTVVQKGNRSATFVHRAKSGKTVQRFYSPRRKVVLGYSYDDRCTQSMARKHGAICVQTDLFKKDGRALNKGAASNARLSRFQYHGWRLQLDADIALPDTFRRMLLNHTHLDPACIYGADRCGVIGIRELRASRACDPQHGEYWEGRRHQPCLDQMTFPRIGAA